MEANLELSAIVSASAYTETLFDHIPDVVYFVKDQKCRYVVVNQTLVTRCGRQDKCDLLGMTTRDVFPTPLGDRFFDQDRRVIASGVPILQNLELHLYPTRLEGWCLTDKIPLLDGAGGVAGVAGISRDLQSPGSETDHFSEIAGTVEHIRAHYSSELRVDDLASISGHSVYQLNRRLRAIFGITASQFITKTRIDVASDLLRETGTPIAEIANSCGYFDQSAFSRVFRRTVGLTPRQYRTRHRRTVQ